MEKIAIHCETKELWNKVLEKYNNDYGSDWWPFYHDHELPRSNDVRGGSCISIDNRRGGHCYREWYENRGYTIIPASEYLKGGNEVDLFIPKELKKGIFEDVYKNLKSETTKTKRGSLCLVSLVYSNRNGIIECASQINCGGCLLHVDSKEGFINYMEQSNKQIKEEVMNVNSTVAKVFKDVDEAILVTQFMGTEYPEGNHRAFLTLKQYKKEVLAEAKRLEKEAKDREKSKE